MKLTTKIKLFFSKNLRDRLSCVDCQLPCYGKKIIKNYEICEIMIWNYEHRKKGKNARKI